jgi:hypothetical protein
MALITDLVAGWHAHTWCKFDVGKLKSPPCPERGQTAIAPDKSAGMLK